MSDWYGQDLQVVSSEEVFDHFVLDDDKSIIEYLKSDWLESALSQMVSARIGLGISQKTLAENIGKSQPAIARLEKGADVKLSVLWDYYAGLGLTPRQHFELENLDEVKAHVRKNKARIPVRRKSRNKNVDRPETRYSPIESPPWNVSRQRKLKPNSKQIGRRDNSATDSPTRYNPITQSYR